MCGIAGILDFGNNSFIDGSLALSRMLDSMLHRGPDDRGEEKIIGLNGTSLWFGHQRLSIIDLSELAHQPMSNFSKTHWITSNGEIYNFKQIRKELEPNHSFISQSDTEVLLKSYETWGNDCLEKLRGMFAFAVWDGKFERLFLARDRLGIKPLYYYSDKKIFIFASEIRALVNSNLINKNLNSDGLFDYLSFGRLQGPNTILDGIQELKPGHYLSISRDTLYPSQKKYWNPIGVKTFRNNKKELQNQIQETLLEATNYRLISDVPIGTFLSGGIDSSALLSLLANLLDDPPITISVIFREKKFDESSFSSKIADVFRTQHKNLLIDQDDLTKALPSAISSMDQPTIDGINTYLISESARRLGLKVVLSGLGGDELFGGYNSFWDVPRYIKWNDGLDKLPKIFRKISANLIQNVFPNSDKKTKLVSLLGGNYIGNHVYYLYRSLFCYPILQCLLSDQNILEKGYQRHLELTQAELDGLTGYDDSQKISWLELTHYMANMLLRDADVMSMAHSLELRTPLIDHKLVELMLSVPKHLRLNPTRSKQLLTDSLPYPLPDAVLKRKKMGFTLPFENWLKTSLKHEIENTLFSPVRALNGYISETGIRIVWQDFLKGKTSWSRPWSLYVLKKWVDQNID